MQIPGHPVLCNYYLTYRCNASCSFCDIWEKPSPYASLENIHQNLLDLKKMGVKVIDFTGGEPLLHQDIPAILQMARDMGFITTLTTNCLLYPKKAESIRGLVDMLHFSLDSPLETEHNQSRGVDCFRFFRESLDIARNLGEQPDVLFTVFKNNLHQIAKVWEEYALRRDLMLILNPVFAYNQVETGEELSKAELAALRLWGKKKNVFLNEAFLVLREEGGNQPENPVCRAGSTTVVISPENAYVLPCYHLGLESLPLNNNLLEVFHSEKARLLRQLEGRLPGCRGCTINCYMQPSFSTSISRYGLLAAPSAIKYNLKKGTWKALFRGASM
jgi:MoaA/NifB/PqqE/SkfB family radical SAM enzyme